MEKLYIFIQDHGVYGMIIVVAKSHDDARSVMKHKHNYKSYREILQFNIEDGFNYANYGDLESFGKDIEQGNR